MYFIPPRKLVVLCSYLGGGCLYLKEMQNLKSDNEQLMKEARAERDAILKEARELKEKTTRLHRDTTLKPHNVF